MASGTISFTTFLMTLLVIPTAYFQLTKAQCSPPLVDGLSWTFYDSTCPKLQHIVRKQLKKAFRADIRLAAGLLRLQFHDCFVQGCDGSVLLIGTGSEPSEQQAPPNLTLSAEALEMINRLHSLVERHCGPIVSCADIVTLAARDAVYLSGGPEYPVPLGRKDSLTSATVNETSANIPAPTFNTSALLSSFARKNLTAIELVALSGAHTIGRGHCRAFTNRLYPTQDPNMNPHFAEKLKQTCPSSNSTNTTVLDIRTPNKFDEKYYIDLTNREGLFTSDQDLYTDPRTSGIAESFADDEALFFEQFVEAIIKMGQLEVLTGTEGEIRSNCSVKNSDNFFLASDLAGEATGRLEI